MKCVYSTKDKTLNRRTPAQTPQPYSALTATFQEPPPPKDNTGAETLTNTIARLPVILKSVIYAQDPIPTIKAAI